MPVRPSAEKRKWEPSRSPAVDVFPGEQDVVLLQHGIDIGGAEALADGAAVFVVDDAGGLIEHLPAALPGQEADVGVFEIEGRKEFVEAAQRKELAAVEGAGSAAAVEAGEEFVDFLVFAMGDAQRAVAPPAAGEAGLFAALRSCRRGRSGRRRRRLFRP